MFFCNVLSWCFGGKLFIRYTHCIPIVKIKNISLKMFGSSQSINFSLLFCLDNMTERDQTPQKIIIISNGTISLKCLIKPVICKPQISGCFPFPCHKVISTLAKTYKTSILPSQRFLLLEHEINLWETKTCDSCES